MKKCNAVIISLASGFAVLVVVANLLVVFTKIGATASTWTGFALGFSVFSFLFNLFAHSRMVHMMYRYGMIYYKFFTTVGDDFRYGDGFFAFFKIIGFSILVILFAPFFLIFLIVLSYIFLIPSFVKYRTLARTTFWDFL